MKKNRKAIWIVALCVLGLIFAVSTVFGILNFRTAKPVTLFGIKMAYVSDDTMEPGLKYRAFVIVKKSDYDTIKVNDTIDFLAPNGSYYETSKVRQITEDGLVIRGDAETMARDYFITENELFGKVVFKSNISANFLNEVGTVGGFLKWIVLPVGCIVLFFVLKRTISRRIEENKVIYRDDDDESLKKTTMITRYNNSMRRGETPANRNSELEALEAGWRNMGYRQEHKNQYAEITERHARENGSYDYDANVRDYDAAPSAYDDGTYREYGADMAADSGYGYGFAEPTMPQQTAPQPSAGARDYDDIFSDNAFESYEERFNRAMGRTYDIVPTRERNYDATPEFSDAFAIPTVDIAPTYVVPMNGKDPEPEPEPEETKEPDDKAEAEDAGQAQEQVIMQAVNRLSEMMNAGNSVPDAPGAKKPEYSIVLDFVAAEEEDAAPSIRVRMLDGDKNTMAMTTFNGDPKLTSDASGLSKINMRLVTPNNFDINEAVQSPLGTETDDEQSSSADSFVSMEGLKGMRLAMGSIIFELEYSTKGDKHEIDYEDYLYSYNIPETKKGKSKKKK